MEKRRITITNNKGEPTLYASLTEEADLYLTFEVFGRNDGFDVESIYTIPKSEFPRIRSEFNVPPDLEILDSIQLISNNGDGLKFEQAVDKKVFEVDKFVWWSDND